MATKNKRRHRRINSLNLINYVCLDEENHFVNQGMGRTLNVSQTGILLETHIPFNPQNKVFVKIGLLEDLVDVEGSVIYSKKSEDGRYESGIHFTRQTRSTGPVLRDYIKAFREVSIERKSPVSLEPDEKIPYIKGPLFDYSYVADEETFNDGEKIVEEGMHGSWIWVVLEGAVDIVKQSANGPVKVLRIGDGSFIWSLASLLVQGNIRSASAVAAGHVQLGVLDSQRLSREFSRLSFDFRTILISLDKRLRQATQWAVEPNIKNEVLEKTIDLETPFFKQGERREQLFKIIQGKASVVRRTDKGFVLLAELQKGDTLGLLPFLDIGHEPNYASVFVANDFKAHPMDSGMLKKEFHTLSFTMKNLIRNLAAYLSVTTVSACTFQEAARDRVSR